MMRCSSEARLVTCTPISAKRKSKATGVSEKTIVLGALERSTEKGKPKVKARVINDVSRPTLKHDIQKKVNSGSTVYTDE